MNTKPCIEPEVEYGVITLTIKGDSLNVYLDYKYLRENTLTHGPKCKGKLTIVEVTKIHNRLTCQEDGCNFNVFYPNRIDTFQKLQEYFSEKIQVAPPGE